MATDCKAASEQGRDRLTGESKDQQELANRAKRIAERARTRENPVPRSTMGLLERAESAMRDAAKALDKAGGEQAMDRSTFPRRMPSRDRRRSGVAWWKGRAARQTRRCGTPCDGIRRGPSCCVPQFPAGSRPGNDNGRMTDIDLVLLFPQAVAAWEIHPTDRARSLTLEMRLQEAEKVLAGPVSGTCDWAGWGRLR
jgi:hypothetical protein